MTRGVNGGEVWCTLLEWLNGCVKGLKAGLKVGLKVGLELDLRGVFASLRDKGVSQTVIKKKKETTL